MRVLVTGAGGQVGSAVMDELRGRGLEGIGTGRRPPLLPLDITDGEAVERTLLSVRPEAVIHCAAWTGVDLAEEERDRARAVNAAGTAHIVRSCMRVDCKLVYLSTDYVFSGEGTAPWRTDGPCRPLNFYGQTKREGELAVAAALERYFIVRTSWVFGANGKNFVNAMLEAGKRRKAVPVVNDQTGAPTYARDLARLLADMVETERYGCYHGANEGGYVSWCQFAREIFRQAGIDAEAVPVTTEAYGRTRARRPRNSRLDTGALVRAGFQPLPPWQDALGRYLREIGQIRTEEDRPWDGSK